MAFRGPLEALRARVEQLRGEVEQAGEERDRVVAALARSREQRELRLKVKLKQGTGLRWWMMPLLVGPTILLPTFYFDPPPDELFYGTVRTAEGTPVESGDLCTVVMSSSCSGHDSRLEVICGGHSLYGGPSRGCLNCDEARLGCADDSDEWSEGGDPRLRFDRRAATVRIDDTNGSLLVEIDLDPPPRATAALAP